MVPVTRPDLAHAPFDEWSALAAVGALDEIERARFDAHLATGCAICEASLREHTEVAAALPWALPDVRLRPDVRDRLMARVAGGAEAPVRDAGDRRGPAAARPAAARIPWRWAGGLVAASLAVAFAWSTHDTRQALESERARVAQLERALTEERAITALVGHTDTQAAALRGVDIGAHAEGWIVWSPSRGQGFVVVHHLPVLPAGQQYRLWVVGAPRWVPAGAFLVDSIGHATLTVQVTHDRPEGFAVTIEPAGPHAIPTGPTVMRGGRPS
jgi:hypothetical protein